MGRHAALAWTRSRLAWGLGSYWPSSSDCRLGSGDVRPGPPGPTSVMASPAKRQSQAKYNSTMAPVFTCPPCDVRWSRDNSSSNPPGSLATTLRDEWFLEKSHLGERR